MSLPENYPSLKSVIDTFTAKKSLGQNFLYNSDICNSIARIPANINTGTNIEIGPGPGGLTRAILNIPDSNLIVVEKDDFAIEQLQNMQQHLPDRLQIINGDALQLNLHELGDYPRRVIANLPYNISTVLYINFLKNIEHFETLTLMFQKEVAQRITAKMGDKKYGRLSVMTQFCGWADIILTLQPGSFIPPPKVESSVIYFQKHPTRPYQANFDTMEHVVKSAFNQRRKMLRQSLKSLLGKDCSEILQNMGINDQQRAEKTSIEEFNQIALYIDSDK